MSTLTPDSGEYVGPRADLYGERALIRPAKRDGYLLAQFDNLQLAELAHGWHEFPASEFRILVRIRV